MAQVDTIIGKTGDILPRNFQNKVLIWGQKCRSYANFVCHFLRVQWKRTKKNLKTAVIRDFISLEVQRFSNHSLCLEAWNRKTLSDFSFKFLFWQNFGRERFTYFGGKDFFFFLKGNWQWILVKNTGISIECRERAPPHQLGNISFRLLLFIIKQRADFKIDHILTLWNLYFYVSITSSAKGVSLKFQF